MSKLKNNFGKRVAELRDETGISQNVLAEKVGVTVETISNIERGVHGPRFDNLEKIAKALSVSVKDLFDF